jgi:diguanylate cyclase (GGDEF)-like protein/PAS domain S-box-containing protein
VSSARPRIRLVSASLPTPASSSQASAHAAPADAARPLALAPDAPERGDRAADGTEPHGPFRLSPAELEALVAATSDVVLVLDRDCRYLRIGTGPRHMLARSPEELLGCTVDEVFPSAVARQMADTVARALETGEVQTLQYPVERAGRTTWFDATVSPTWEGTVVWVARDVSDRRSAESALRERERDVRELFEAAFDGMLVCGTDLRCLDANTRLCGLLGRTRAELLALDYAALIDPAHLVERPLRMDELYAERRLVTERRLLRADGTLLYADVGTSLLDDGRVLFVIRDVTERKQAEETIRALALLDELTELYNRRGFLALAEREWDRARGEGRGALLAVFDLDDLKPINDTYGHAAGDAALVAVAGVLRSTFRGSDVVGRLGGDEFVALVVPGGPSSGLPTDADARLAMTARLVRERFARHLADHNVVARAMGRPYDLAVSIGLAQASDGSPVAGQPASLAALLAEADARLYEEKRGRKRGTRN